MPFKISYTGDATTYMVAADTPERKGDEFYERMNKLVSQKDKKLLTRDVSRRMKPDVI